jgi:hypothetical protein
MGQILMTLKKRIQPSHLRIRNRPHRPLTLVRCMRKALSSANRMINFTEVHVRMSDITILNSSAIRTLPKRVRDDSDPRLSDVSLSNVDAKRKPRDLSTMSYADMEGKVGFELPPSQFLNPDEIDGVPIDGGERIQIEKRSSTIALPVTTRPLIRRATDFPMPPPSPSQSHSLSPKSAAIILKNVLGVVDPVMDPVESWNLQRNEHKCPLCLDVLVRPVDVVGCGHYVCRTHVIDIYQHGGSRNGIRCCVCRHEDNVDDFNRIEVDQELWSRIQRAKFHHSRRRSVSPSRSLTPLRDRFNRKFLNDIDF